MSEAVAKKTNTKVNSGSFELFDTKKRFSLNIMCLLAQLVSGMVSGISGIAAVQIGATLAGLADSQNTTLASGVTIATIALFSVGLILSGLLSPIFLKKIGVINSLKISLILNLIGSGLIFIFGLIAFAIPNKANFSLGIAIAMFAIGQFIIGFAAGMLVSSLTFALIENNKTTGGINKYLNLSQSMYGIGISVSAFIGPVVGAAAQAGGENVRPSWQWYYLAIIGIIVLLLLLFFIIKFHEKHRVFLDMEKNKHESFENLQIAKTLDPETIKKGRKSLILVLLLFVVASASFIFIENTVTATWSIGMQENDGTGFGGGIFGVGVGGFLSAQLVGVVIGSFWVCETLGRIIYAFFSHKISELKVIGVCGVFVSLAAGLFLLNSNGAIASEITDSSGNLVSSGSLAIAIIFAGMLGFFGAPIFPAILTYASKATKNPNVVKIVPGLMLSSGFTTGILITLSQLGTVSPSAGNPQTGFLGFTAAIVVIGILMTLAVAAIALVRSRLGKAEATGS